MKMTKLIYLFAVPLLVASCISEEVPITDASDHFFKVSAANPDIQQIVFLLKQKMIQWNLPLSSLMLLPRRINRNMSWQADGKQSAFS